MDRYINNSGVHADHNSTMDAVVVSTGANATIRVDTTTRADIDAQLSALIAGLRKLSDQRAAGPTIIEAEELRQEVTRASPDQCRLTRLLGSIAGATRVLDSAGTLMEHATTVERLIHQLF